MPHLLTVNIAVRRRSGLRPVQLERLRHMQGKIKKRKANDKQLGVNLVGFHKDGYIRPEKQKLYHKRLDQAP
jgi:hypothetical protein